MANNKIGVIAFSGGLDTSFLVPYAREEYALERVITVTVNTGGSILPNFKRSRVAPKKLEPMSISRLMDKNISMKMFLLI